MNFLKLSNKFYYLFCLIKFFNALCSFIFNLTTFYNGKFYIYFYVIKKKYYYINLQLKLIYFNKIFYFKKKIFKLKFSNLL